MNEPYDVAIVGAGPAGSTAASLLARKDYRVVLIDRAPAKRPGSVAAWLGSGALPLLEEMGIKPETVTKPALTDVVFHNADFSKSTQPVFDQAAGYLVDRMRFATALTAHARKCGAEVCCERSVDDIVLKENHVEILMEGSDQIQSKLLLLAAGTGSHLLDRLGFPSHPGGESYWTAQVCAPLKKKEAGSPRLAAILGLDKAGSFAVACISQDGLSVTLNWLMERESVISNLIVMCKSAFEHGVVPVDLSAEAAKAKPVRSPASVALDLETHVGKHTLLIGDSGGFVAAASNEGLYPAMWSAQIAVGVLDRALKTEHSQDVLMAFDSEWRMQMADYLRSPNTDPQFLLPLVFSNQAMANRMGAAFFHGENI